MKIGIVGCGKVGGALGKWFASLGHEVAFTAQNKERLDKFVKDTGQGSIALPLTQLAETRDVIFLALPFSKVNGVLESVRGLLKGKILVDLTNPLTEDHRDLSIGHTDSGAETIARNFPEAMVVKAFNATFAEVYASGDPTREGHPLTICFAGDDGTSKGIVGKLIQDMGFDALDAGALKNSRYLEPLSLLNIQLGRELGYGTSVGFSFLRS